VTASRHMFLVLPLDLLETQSVWLYKTVRASLLVVIQFSVFKKTCRQHHVVAACRLQRDTVLCSFRPSALSMLTFVKVLTGAIDDDTHAGKMAVYLNKLLQLNPGRTHVYGALTNLEHAVVYVGVQDGKIRYSQPVRMEKGTCTSGL